MRRCWHSLTQESANLRKSISTCIILTNKNRSRKVFAKQVRSLSQGRLQPMSVQLRRLSHRVHRVLRVFSQNLCRLAPSCSRHEGCALCGLICPLCHARKIRKFVLYFACGCHPLIRHRELPLLPPRVVVQKAGGRIREPSRNGDRLRTPPPAWAESPRLQPHADGWVDSGNARAGSAGRLLHRAPPLKYAVRNTQYLPRNS